MSIPSNWPIQKPSPFEYKTNDSEKNAGVYKLNDLKLSNDECHMFFPVAEPQELLIATALEYMTFNPANKKMNDKFNLVPVKCGDIELFWCCFPKEFKDVCERAGKLFGMTMKIMPRMYVGGGIDRKETTIEIPKKDNILSFQIKDRMDRNKISAECDDITWLGNCLEKLGVD